MFGLWDPNNQPDPSANPLLALIPEEEPQAPDPFVMEEPQAPAPDNDPPELLDTPAPAPVVTPPAPVQQAQAPALNPDELVQKIMQAMQTQTPPAPAVTEPVLTPEEIEERDTKVRDAILDNPRKFLEDYKAEILAEAQKGFDSKFAPIEQERQSMQKAQELRELVDSFRANTPDYDEHVSDMAQYLSEKPHLEGAPDALEIAYEAVKGRKLASMAANPTMQPGSEEFMKAAIADPAVKEAMQKALLEEIKNGQPPIVVKGSGNLGMPTAPNKPTDIKGASALFRQSQTAKGY